MSLLYLDVESRSAVNLPKAGAHRYWEDDTTALWCACYAFDEEPVEAWRPGQPCPPRIVDHVRAGGWVSAWNANFEKLAWWHALTPVHGWPKIALEQFDDTAAWAAAMALPRALENAAKAVGAPVQKDKDGYNLMMRMAKPRKARKGEDPSKLYWWDDEERLQRLIEYCKVDVATERAVKAKLIPLSPAEREVWLFDARMNDRGVHVDLEFADALREIAAKAKKNLDAQIARATNWQVTACSQVTALKEWVEGETCRKLDSLDANRIEGLLSEDDLPQHVREALEARRDAAKTSTAKLDAMDRVAGSNDRLRGLHLYHGASTGRWSGRLVQCQNMPRGTGVIKDPDSAARDILSRDPDIIEMIHGPAMRGVSDCLRGCLTASPGNRLVVADYSSIEGRVTAWVAREEWVLDAYRAADRGEGAGMYEITAAGIFNCPVQDISKGDPRRLVGKTGELALGFAGGVAAFDAFAQVYHVDMRTAYAPLRETTDGDTWDKAVESYDRWKAEGVLATDRMHRDAWIASEVTKLKWRDARPKIVACWDGLQDAAWAAVENPGTVYRWGNISYVVRRGFLWCMLPSRRCLAYGAPRIMDWKTPWGEKLPSITALGTDSTTGRWRRYALTRQITIENVVQAIARDLMAHGMLKAEAAGYPIVLTVHDEAVADVRRGRGTLHEFENLLCDLPAWATDLPVVAEGYEAQRYRK